MHNKTRKRERAVALAGSSNPSKGWLSMAGHQLGQGSDELSGCQARRGNNIDLRTHVSNAPLHMLTPIWFTP